MKTCTHCQTILSDDAQFCASCGEKLSTHTPTANPPSSLMRACAHCGKSVPRSSKQCPFCKQPTVPKKRSKTPIVLVSVLSGMILLILLAVAVLLFASNCMGFMRDKPDASGILTGTTATSHTAITAPSFSTTTTTTYALSTTTTARTRTTTTTPPSGSVIPEATQYHSAIEYAVIALDGANLRTGPSTDYPVLCAIATGEAVYATATDGSWVYIVYKQHTGWVHISNLQRMTLSNDFVEPTSYFSESLTVFASFDDGVNLRTGPSTDYAIICSIAKGETLEAVAQQGTWYYGYYNGTAGWFSKNFVTPAQDTP